MSDTHRRILTLGAWLVGLMTAFPPWCVDSVHYAQPGSYAVGYSFIADPPGPPLAAHARVDGVRLGFQLLAVAALVGAHLFACARQKPAGLSGSRDEPITSIRR